MSDWPDAVFEAEMLAVLNELRVAGAACAGSLGAPTEPLTESPTLRCAARVQPMVGVPFGTYPAPVTEVALLSEPPATLDVSTFARRILKMGGWECEQLLSPEFSIAGIGFATDGFWGYWTFFLASS